jgi:class 3 adenylate cyclase
VQRALVDHRRDHGFAPQGRIGVHVAEATKRGTDYSGGEVHKAARIGALAEGGQILASVDAIRAADQPVRTADHRIVNLKGVAHPVEVASIDWQHAGT